MRLIDPIGSVLKPETFDEIKIRIDQIGEPLGVGTSRDGAVSNIKCGERVRQHL